MSALAKAWKVFDRHQHLRLCELLVLILIGTALETVGVTAIVPFISAIMYPDKMMENKYVILFTDRYNISDSNHIIIILALMLIAVYVLKNVFLCCMYAAQFNFVYNNQKRLANRLMICYIKQPYAFHLEHNSAEIIESISGDVDLFYQTVMHSINLVTDVMVSAALIIVLFVVDKTITLVVATVMMLFILLFYRYYKERILELGISRRDNATKSFQYIQEAFGAIKEIKILRKEDYFVREEDRTFGEFVDSRKKVAIYTMYPKPIMETLAVGALMVVVVVKIASGVSAEYFIPTLSVFALSVIRLLPSANRISGALNNITYGKPSIDRISDDMELMKELEKKIPGKNANTVLRFEKGIRISNLSFGYPSNERRILDDVSLYIEKNSSTAFIGASGAGKTTLADIILGVLEYDIGSIKIDEMELCDNYEAWQSIVGYIPQNIYIVDDTIRRNIAFAMNDKDIDEKRLQNAVEMAQLEKFITEQPNGLDTVIGEMGTRISGGQRQRIGIARALYNNPEVLVLDEATSALDNDTEKAVMEAIDSLNGKKTLIIIAHRLSTIKSCDSVYRIKDGKISQERIEV